MAVGKMAWEPIADFGDWYTSRYEDRDGCLEFRGLTPQADAMWSKWEFYRREHQQRVRNYDKYEQMAAGEVVSRKPDLPNVSSGDIAGMVRRTSRNVVQNTPNVEIICEFDDDSPKGILAKHVLKTKIIGDELNSNQMQQNLFASVMSAFTLGFDAVVPVLLQRADQSWCMEYDAIHYQDVFPEPGCKDASKTPSVFVRRYLTKAEVAQLVNTQAIGWDIPALRKLLKSRPPSKQRESVSNEEKKSGQIPEGYEVVTWYNAYGDPFITFDANSKMLLRIEKNKDPLKRHPVQFLILEKDPQQPFGKSQISLVFGRQEFQDLMLNGAMKLWYRNINPSLIGYGTGLNGVPNMSPGKYTNVPNPNAKIEAFEVNTQTLLQYHTIAQANAGSMINLVGAADQQMAAQAGNGMSATPQGVEAQEAMVDITTNNYQKAVEYFFSKYCSYALTVYFAELRNTKKLVPSADARRALVAAGVPAELFDEDGALDIDMKEMATVYNVRCVPGSLVELEDEKQLRILNELFVPLSQAMPAIAATQNPEMLANAAAAMQFIINKQIKLSGSAHSEELAEVLESGVTPQLTAFQERTDTMERQLGELVGTLNENSSRTSDEVSQLREQVGLMSQTVTTLLEKLGVTQPTNGAPALESAPPVSPAAPV